MVYAWFEFGVVIISLLTTLLVGLYFSRDGRKSLKEYMLGNRQMTPLPIILSIAATYLTGTSLVATTQEVYMFGMQASTAALFYAVNGVILSWVYLPVSYSIKSASCFEFFDRRFNKHIRKFASVIYAFETLHHTAMSQLIPALVLSQASGLPVFPLACALSLFCYVYTTSGGLKAVCWADSIQAIIFMSSIVIMFVVGIFIVGGPSKVWQKGVEGSRIEFFDFDTSLHLRYSFIVLTIGSIFLAPNLYLTPSFHQRVASMPTFKQARQVSVWSSIFAGVFFFFAFNMGLVVYAYFAGCDPVLAKKNIDSYHTILPYFVNQICHQVPGILGLFLSGVLAAGLSTTTSCWNTVACTFYEDLIRPMLKPDVPIETSFKILQGLVLAVAVFSTAIIPLLNGMRSLLEATLALKGVTTSVFFILYNAGMFLPWVNSVGVFIGSMTAGLITLNVILGNQEAKSHHLVKELPKMLTTAKCLINGTTLEALNLTTSIGTEGFGQITVADPSIPWHHKLGMMVFNLPGAGIGLLVTCLVSFLTGTQDLATIDREMIVPQMQWVLPSVKCKSQIEKKDVESGNKTNLKLAPLLGKHETTK